MLLLLPYAGLFGAYLLRDPTGLEANLSLPQGEYEMPLVLTDRSFLADGSIFYPSNGDNPDVHPHWLPEYFGNTQIVNGKVGAAAQGNTGHLDTVLTALSQCTVVQ